MAHGLGDAARRALGEARLVIGVGRTLDLVRPHLAANCAVRDMDGALAQSPAWIAEALESGQPVAVLATGDPLCHGIASWLTGKLGRDGFAIIPAVSTLQLAFARFKTAWQDVAESETEQRLFYCRLLPRFNRTVGVTADASAASQTAAPAA